MWVTVASANGERHIQPVADFRPHEPSRECWCHPSEEADDPWLLVHNAMDQRDLIEIGRKRVH